ncbi:hypothetical protein BPAE_0046g00280 [Botrytis paeoniae]|uniref:Amidase domain-containing protein n=1 Tax=Botrytis paeoniae TaxID=278948 RepID=A0A4Z1FYI7_9HELO|nr:hypothetical protein BPAE_0046g00280 [Botrytis paeoniae]
MLDDERSMGTLRGPLHGIPILIKDVIATKYNMNNTAGSYALIGAKVPADPTIARKLREAGVIILGKTNPSQWGHFRSFNISNGWSARGRQTYGPYIPRIDITPSCGPSQRTHGYYWANDEDCQRCRLCSSSIAGVDPLDNYTSAIPYKADLDFVNACNFSALKGARLSIPRNVISLMSNNSTGSMLEAFNKSLAILRSAGAIILENTDFLAAQESIDNGLLKVQIVAADFVVAVEKYLSSLVYNPHNITDLADLREWTQSNPLEDYPKNLQKLEAVILPSLFSWNWAAVVGAPVISVSMGAMPSDQPIVSDADGLVSAEPLIPFGFSFLGARFTDAKLIGLAYAFEQRTMKRRTVHPYIKPRTDLRDMVGMHFS